MARKKACLLFCTGPKCSIKLHHGKRSNKNAQLARMSAFSKSYLGYGVGAGLL
jgi:hypothetical protein